MGTVFRKAWTAPLPPGAEIVAQRGRRLARWRLRSGKLRTAEVIEGRDGSLRIRGATRTYIAKYRDAAGIWREHPTGCRDETAARAVLAQLQRRAELIRAGVMTNAEDAASDHGRSPLAKHTAAYIDHLKAKGCAPHRIAQVKSRLERIGSDCAWVRLGDLRACALERWLVEQKQAGMAAATRNGYREAWLGFANWCCRTQRLVENPFLHVPRADSRSDIRRQRRALTEDELQRLIETARRRPLIEALTIRRGKYKGRQRARVRPDVQRRLEALGNERALIYKTLVLTGLRKGELTSLTVGQVDPAGPTAHLLLRPKDEKNRRGSQIPLRSDLADELCAWLGKRLAQAQRTAAERGEPLPSRLAACEKLFNVPAGLVRILDRDLAAAGIPKRDERGRTVDVHAMRHTFGTHLSKAGVPLRTAQAAMRHSDPSLTANVYTDPKLLDVAGALEALPLLRANGHDRQVVRT